MVGFDLLAPDIQIDYSEFIRIIGYQDGSLCFYNQISFY